nr:glutamate receptor ionotropic, NMDA 2A-like [Ciona intestinalis]|eukprot:XP_009859789.2 glutamate receptor ionotropic, NMDA 2A-like [Ciona intestinalis]
MKGILVLALFMCYLGLVLGKMRLENCACNSTSLKQQFLIYPRIGAIVSTAKQKAVFEHYLSMFNHNERAMNTYNQNTWMMKNLNPFKLDLSIVVVNETDPSELLQTICEEIVSQCVLYIMWIPNTFADPLMSWLLPTLSRKVKLLTFTTDHLKLTPSFLPTKKRYLYQFTPSVDDTTNTMLSMVGKYDWKQVTLLVTEAPGYDTFLTSWNSKKDQINCKTDIIGPMDVWTTPNDKIIQLLDGIQSMIVVVYASLDELGILFQNLGKTNKKTVSRSWLVHEIGLMKRLYNEEQKLAYSLQSHPDATFVTELPDYFPKPLSILVHFPTSNRGTQSILQAILPITKALAEKELQKNFGAFHYYMKNNLWKHPYFINQVAQGISSYLKVGDPPKFNENGYLFDPSFTLLSTNSDNMLIESPPSLIAAIKLNNVTLWRQLHTDPSFAYLSKDRHIRVVTLGEASIVTVDNSSSICSSISVQCYVTDIETKHTFDAGDHNDSSFMNVWKPSCCKGFCIDLLQQLKKEIGFTYNIFVVRHGRHGKFTKDGEWEGAVGDVVNGKADVAVGSITINKQREYVVDFSVPFMETGIGIMVNKFNGTVPPFAFLGPYDCLSWACMLVVAMLASSIAVLTFEYFSPSGYNGDITINKNASRFTLGKSIWLHYGIMVNNSVPIENPHSPSSRYMVSVWAFFCVIFLAMYTANLAAFMIQEESEDVITGLTDKRFTNPTATNPPFRFGTVPNGSTELNMRTYYPLYHRYMEGYNMESLNDAVEALKTRKLDAFLYDYAVLKYAAGKDKDCEMNVIRKPSFTSGYGVVFTKHSPWKEKFDIVLLNLMQNGYIERISNVWLTGLCGLPTKSRDFTSSRLDISNMAGLFIMLGGALALSILVFLFEHIFSRYVRRHLMNCSPNCFFFIRTISRGIYNCLVGEDFKKMKARRIAVKCSQPVIWQDGRISTHSLLPRIFECENSTELVITSTIPRSTTCSHTSPVHHNRQKRPKEIVSETEKEILKKKVKPGTLLAAPTSSKKVSYRKKTKPIVTSLAIPTEHSNYPIYNNTEAFRERHKPSHVYDQIQCNRTTPTCSRNSDVCSCSQNLRSNSACSRHNNKKLKSKTPSPCRRLLTIPLSRSFGSLRDSLNSKPVCSRMRSMDKLN